MCNDVSLSLVAPRPPADKTVLDLRDWISWVIKCTRIGRNGRSGSSHVMVRTCYDLYILEIQPRTRRWLSCVQQRGNANRDISPLGPPYSCLFPSPLVFRPLHSNFEMIY